MSGIRELTTHDGRFHADDVLAAFLLREIARLDASEPVVRRTRDPDAIRAAPGRTVFDVGGIHDASSGLFDHHQNGRTLRPDGIPYSSFGLVWVEFGLAFLAAWTRRDPALAPGDLSDGLLAGAFADARDGFVREIDIRDNGVGVDDVSVGHVSSLIEDLNPRGEVSASDQDRAFADAMEVAGTLLLAHLRSLVLARLSVDEFVRQATYPEPGIAVLRRPASWKRAVFDLGLDDLVYVVVPKGDGRTWYVSAVPPTPRSLDQRLPLPMEWAGLSDEAMVAASGVSDAVFCHASRFVCAARSEEGALRLARLAIAARRET